MRGITVFGIGDAYLMANTNQPPGGENLLRNFDTRSGAVRLNYVEAAIERKTSESTVLGFRADLGAGPVARMVGAPEPGPSGPKYIQQAYVSVRAPIGSGLTVDAGKFVTPAGAEVIETQDNWQGESTGVAQEVVEGTLTVQRTIAAGLTARAEYRVDRSTTTFFPNEDGVARRWQQTVGVGLFYGWASR